MLRRILVIRPGRRMPELSQECWYKLEQVVLVPFEEPPRFLDEPEKPFGARALHPLRRALQPAGQEIDGSTCPDHHRRPDGAVVLENPFFLLRAAKANEHDVRPCGA